MRMASRYLNGQHRRPRAGQRRPHPRAIIALGAVMAPGERDRWRVLGRAGRREPGIGRVQGPRRGDLVELSAEEGRIDK